MLKLAALAGGSAGLAYPSLLSAQLLCQLK
ncbi:MAG UNVERIFIED_CONTAM: hypothetical protein LVR29_13470 [Microcystis novacekii LVE1205-3]